jgi:hypothetical protein
MNKPPDDDKFMASDVRQKASAFNAAVQIARTCGLTVEWGIDGSRGLIEVTDIKRVTTL